MTRPFDESEAAWRKSSYSTSNGGNCVELAPVSSGIAVRDSKNPDRGVLLLSRRTMQTLRQRQDIR